MRREDIGDEVAWIMSEFPKMLMFIFFWLPIFVWGVVIVSGVTKSVRHQLAGENQKVIENNFKMVFLNFGFIAILIIGRIIAGVLMAVGL